MYEKRPLLHAAHALRSLVPLEGQGLLQGTQGPTAFNILAEQQPALGGVHHLAFGSLGGVHVPLAWLSPGWVLAFDLCHSPDSAPSSWRPAHCAATQPEGLGFSCCCALQAFAAGGGGLRAATQRMLAEAQAAGKAKGTIKEKQEGPDPR